MFNLINFSRKFSQESLSEMLWYLFINYPDKTSKNLCFFESILTWNLFGLSNTFHDNLNICLMFRFTFNKIHRIGCLNLNLNYEIIKNSYGFGSLKLYFSSCFESPFLTSSLIFFNINILDVFCIRNFILNFWKITEKRHYCLYRSKWVYEYYLDNFPIKIFAVFT
jgi:hypothetical protein